MGAAPFFHTPLGDLEGDSEGREGFFSGAGRDVGRLAGGLVGLYLGTGGIREDSGEFRNVVPTDERVEAVGEDGRL
jgi:hypothetical protein